MAKHPANIVESIYVLADHLLDASRVLEGTYGLNGIQRDLSVTPQRADQFEKLMGDVDLGAMAKAIRAYAEAWQAELDAELVAAEA